MGWEEYDTKTHDSEDVNLIFMKRPKLQELPSLVTSQYEVQKINHFPMAGFFCIKDQLYRMLKKQRALYGQMYNFVPLTFILPNDYSKFIDVFTRRQVDSSLHLHSNDFYQLQDDRAAQKTIYAQNGFQP